jgi:metallo-beta-lactamase family protein
LICESTFYGDREHGDQKHSRSILCDVVQARHPSRRRHGHGVIRRRPPQQLIYLLRVLEKAGRIPQIPIYLDSPMAARRRSSSTSIDEHDMSEDRSISAEDALKAPNVHVKVRRAGLEADQ